MKNNMDEERRKMRSIKFRAWDRLNNKMYHTPFNGKIGEINDIFLNAGNWIYLQYTGQIDKDGTEVYEEDILEVNTVIGKDFSQVLLHFTNRYVVTFENAGFSFGGYTFGNSHLERIKVIGNIYENPELTPSSTLSRGGGE
jgi:uncharacterized phage protein (TIGR01671 family)